MERAGVTLSEGWVVGQALGGGWFDGRGITALRQSQPFNCDFAVPRSGHSNVKRFWDETADGHRNWQRPVSWEPAISRSACAVKWRVKFEILIIDID